MPIDENRLLDLMEQGKVHFQDIVETSVLQANIRKDWMKFGAQILVTVAAMSFALTMTATHPGSEGIYIPIVTGIMGYWLPSPEVPRSSPWKATDVPSGGTGLEFAPAPVATTRYPATAAADDVPDDTTADYATEEDAAETVPENAPMEETPMPPAARGARATRRTARAAQSEQV